MDLERLKSRKGILAIDYSNKQDLSQTQQQKALLEYRREVEEIDERMEEV